MKFKDRVALVTGASSGIGKSIVLELSRKGCDLVLVGRNKERLLATKKAVMENGSKALAASCDVSDYNNVKNMVSIVLKELGHIDILVNCAGFGICKPFEDTSAEELESIMRTNFFGAVYCTKQVLPGMLARKEGNIVNIASMAGRISFPNYTAYCASKFALAGFTESLYHELKPKGIKVHLICPAGTQTSFFDHPSFENHPHRTNFEDMMHPRQVSKKVIEAMEKDIFEINIPTKEKFMLIAKSLFPSVFRKMQQERHIKRHLVKRVN